MLTGRVKLYQEDRGWGFIVPDDGGADVFLHRRSLNGLVIVNGLRVGFVDKATAKGRRAVNVVILRNANEPTTDLAGTGAADAVAVQDATGP
jgi:CspA family cold shock protein